MSIAALSAIATPNPSTATLRLRASSTPIANRASVISGSNHPAVTETRYATRAVGGVARADDDRAVDARDERGRPHTLRGQSLLHLLDDRTELDTEPVAGQHHHAGPVRRRDSREGAVGAPHSARPDVDERLGLDELRDPPVDEIAQSVGRRLLEQTERADRTGR